MTIAKPHVVPMVLLLALAVMLNFVDRGELGIAGPVMSAQLGLSPARFGLAASAFFWTYGLCQPFVGRAADRWSAAQVLTVSVGLWALATLATGLTAGLAMLVGLRLVLGLGEAALMPCASKLVATHVPQARRGLANSAIATGLALGPAVGTLAGGLILARHGWHMVFFTFGAVTLAWLVPWLLATRRVRGGDAAASPVALGTLLRRGLLWRIGAAHVLANYGFFFLSIWLPLYLVKSRGLPIATMTLYATAAFAAQALASLGWGMLADAQVRAGRDPARVKRRLAVVAQLGSALGIAGIALAQGDRALLVALVMTGVFQGCLPTMVYALGQIYAGAKDAAGWIGVQNAIGSLSGIVGPILTGLIVGATGSFAGAFGFAVAVCVAGAGVFALALP